MNRETFRAPRLEWLFLASLLCSLCASGVEFREYARNGSLATLLAAIGVAYCAGLMAFFLWSIRHPVLEVADDEIVHGPVGAFRRKRIPLREVEAIEVSTPRRVVLRLRSGKRAKVRLRYVAKAQRAAAREAIERRIAEESA